MSRQRKDGRNGKDGIQRLIRDADTGNLRATREGEQPTRYKVWHRDGAGRLVGRTFKTMRDAEYHQRRIAGQRDRGELADNRAGRINMDELWHVVYDTRKLAGRTRGDLTRLWARVPAAFRAKEVRDIRAHVVDDMLNGIPGEVANVKVRGMISLMLRTAKHRGYIANIPWEPMKVRGTRAEVMARAARRQHALTMPELKRLIDATPDLFKLYVEVLGRVGLRPGEARALTVGQLGPMYRTMTIDRALSKDEHGKPEVGPTKTGTVRTVPIAEDLAAKLRDHVAAFSCPSDPEAVVFPSIPGGPHHIDEHNWSRRVFRPAIEAAGIEPPAFRLYDLRHTACSTALAHGIDPVTVANMSGHDMRTLLATYAHVLSDRAEAAADRLGAIWEAAPEPQDAEVSAIG